MWGPRWHLGKVRSGKRGVGEGEMIWVRKKGRVKSEHNVEED